MIHLTNDRGKKLIKKKALGRGLSSLLSDNLGSTSSDKDEKDGRLDLTGGVVLPIENLKPNPNQPRKKFDPEDLKELSETIRDKGILQPLIVVKGSDKEYEIVAGERRWRAAQLANLHEVPVIVKKLNAEEIIEIAIIENVQRAELSPLEEAAGYMKLAEKFNYKHEKIAKMVGKSRPYISNTIRLLSLPKEVMDYVRNGHISSGHARAILNSNDPISLSRLVVKKGLSVRQTEFFAKRQKLGIEDLQKKEWGSLVKDPDTVELERSLTAYIKLTTKIFHDKKKKSGKVHILYRNLEELDTICDILKAKK